MRTARTLESVSALSMIACLSAVSCTRRERAGDEREPTARVETTGSETVRNWQQITREWPESSKAAAKEMTDKYGAPDEATATQLVWHQRGPWKKSVLSREEVVHEWPSRHVDVLEQVIDFRVPPDKFDELAHFDGSVMVERTKGELSARCGGESANFLAVNLAREIVEGTRTVDDARRFYENTMKAKKTGQTSEYLSGLRFTPPRGTSDPDRAVP